MRFILCLILPVLISCASEPFVSISNCSTVEVIGAVDQTADRSSAGVPRLFISVQRKDRLDPNGEWMQGGEIHQIRMLKKGIEIRKMKISNRDEYPFHPDRILFHRRNGADRLVVINYAMRHNATIEYYSIKNETLHFERRERSDLLRQPLDIATDGGDLYFFVENSNTILGTLSGREGIIIGQPTGFQKSEVGGSLLFVENMEEAGALIAGSSGRLHLIRITADGLRLIPDSTMKLRGEIRSISAQGNSLLVSVRDKKRNRILRIGYDPAVGFLKPETVLNEEDPEEIDQTLDAGSGVFILKNRGVLKYCGS